ncbi:GADL1 decarboxylase, partial [Atractosteus spatula]|nr:GADL1 decarboxylase [Atractosteus spatula]
MEKALSDPHPGTHKTSSGSSSSSDRGNAARKAGRSGSHSPGSGSGSAGSPAGCGGSRAGVPGNSAGLPQQLEGVLSKYTNLLQGWQNRYFVLDPEARVLQYFVGEPSKTQKPRGALPLAGASVSQSDEAPHMFVVYSANGELYKLRAADAKEQQFWMSQLQACAKLSDSSAKGSAAGRTRSFSLLPHGAANTSSPGSQRQLPHGGGSSIVTITHHKSPAAARRAKNQYPGRLLEVKEIMSQAEGQQRNLVHSIESLPAKGPLSALDQDLLLLKATSAATLSCLGECLNILQQNVSQVTQQSRGMPAESAPAWPGPKASQSAEQLKNGGLTPFPSAGAHLSWSAEPSPAPSLSSTGLPQGEELCVRVCGGEGGGGCRIRNHRHHRVLFPRKEEQPAAGSELHSLPSPCVSLALLRCRRRASPLAPLPAMRSTWTHSTPVLTRACSHPAPEAINPSEEMTDTEDNEEEDLGVMDDQRSIILHLLSQLKLGMDLTRLGFLQGVCVARLATLTRPVVPPQVVLPTFILEKRSLLEMYANFMAHPDLFVAVTAAATPEERMVRFVEYYLTAFHEGRRGAVAKKPYNPIIGETFHCSWDVPRDRARPRRASGAAPVPGDQQDSCRVRFVAEQVSHHPPVSAFYCECKERKMCVNAHVWTKSKFMGMSIGVSMVGEGLLCLMEHDEEYVFTLPCAYARSILTVPWVELGGKVSINCAKTGYSATVTFQTKPFYGGKVHRVTAEVKHNPTNTIVCKAQGEWNGTLEFTYSSGETKVIDTTKLPATRKRIRPVEKQGPFESRRLWQHVTAALKEGNIDAATEHKHHLEERQRTEERQRASSSTPWKPKYFIKEVRASHFLISHPLLSQKSTALLTDVSSDQKRTGQKRTGVTLYDLVCPFSFLNGKLGGSRQRTHGIKRRGMRGESNPSVIDSDKEIKTAPCTKPTGFSIIFTLPQSGTGWPLNGKWKFDRYYNNLSIDFHRVDFNKLIRSAPQADTPPWSITEDPTPSETPPQQHTQLTNDEATHTDEKGPSDRLPTQSERASRHHGGGAGDTDLKESAPPADGRRRSLTPGGAPLRLGQRPGGSPALPGEQSCTADSHSSASVQERSRELGETGDPSCSSMTSCHGAKHGICADRSGLPIQCDVTEFRLPAGYKYDRGLGRESNADSSSPVKNAVLVDGVFLNGPILDSRAGQQFVMEALPLIVEEAIRKATDVNEKVCEWQPPELLKHRLDLELRERGETHQQILERCREVIRYSVKTGHPRFFNQLYAGLDPYSLVGRFITEALNPSVYTYEVSPVFVLIEESVLKKMIEFVGWEEGGDGMFSPGGSVSNMYAVNVARHKLFPNIKEEGLSAQPRLVMFTSEESHYSVRKAAAFLGIGTKNVYVVPADDRGKMIPEELEKQIERAKSQGAVPFMVSATAGTTVLGAFDPLEDIADICERNGLWFHVDVSLLTRQIIDIILGHNENYTIANSVAWNPHKMLMAGLQCCAFLVRDKTGLLQRCHSAQASYLFQPDKFYDIGYDTGDKSIQCSRKPDAFKFWLMWKAIGTQGLEERVNRALALSKEIRAIMQCFTHFQVLPRYLAEEVKNREGFRLLLEPEYANVCFWYVPPSLRKTPEGPEFWKKLHEVAPVIKERMMKKGTMMVGYQPHRDKVNFFRQIIISPQVSREDVDFVLQEIETLGKDL